MFLIVPVVFWPSLAVSYSPQKGCRSVLHGGASSSFPRPRLLGLRQWQLLRSLQAFLRRASLQERVAKREKKYRNPRQESVEQQESIASKSLRRRTGFVDGGLAAAACELDAGFSGGSSAFPADPFQSNLHCNQVKRRSQTFKLYKYILTVQAGPAIPNTSSISRSVS